MVYRHHRGARISQVLEKRLRSYSRRGTYAISLDEVGVFTLLLPHLVSMASIPCSYLPI